MAKIVESDRVPEVNRGRPSIYDDVINDAIDKGTCTIEAENRTEYLGIKQRLYCRGYMPRCRGMVISFQGQDTSVKQS